MADKDAVEGTEDEEAVDEEVREEVSDSMVAMMEQREQTMLFPEYKFDPDVFITAQGTDLDEDDILNASVQYRFDQQQRKGRKQRKQRGMDVMQASAMVNPSKAFLAKCETQITDFRISMADREGVVGPRAFDKGSSVADRDNREAYIAMLRNPDMRDRVEGFLDYLAGRGTDAQQDFEDLLFEQPQLLKTS